MLRALETLAENGITSVSDAGGYWLRGHHLAWLRAATEKAMTVRASNAFYVYPNHDLESQVARITALKASDSSSLVRFDQVKIYVDGIITQGTAALKAPYDAPPLINGVGDRGFEYFSHADLFEYVKRFDAAGFSIHFHATGDRGVALALDAVQAARNSNGGNGSARKLHRITHLFMVDTADMPRFAQLGVVADFQFTHSSIRADTHERYIELIGDRAHRLMPIAALLKSGAHVTLSSDWDADQLSPLAKIELVVGHKGNGITTVLEAIELLTLAPAHLLGHESRTGSLVVGKQADLVILDRDITSIPIQEIAQTVVLATLLGGKVVFDSDGLFED